MKCLKKLRSNSGHAPNRVLLLVAILNALLGFNLHAAVLDFSMPLTNISVAVSTSAVTLSVFDPAQGKDIQTNINTVGATNLVIADGIVLWSEWARGFVEATYYFTYDPYVTNWVGGSSRGPDSGAWAAPQVGKGMAAWVSITSIRSAVYDQARSRWITRSKEVGPNNVRVLSVADGVVLWGTDSRVGYFTHEPSDGFWKDEAWSWSYATRVTPIFNGNGVVAWSDASSILAGAWMATYDPSRRSWRWLSTVSQTVSRMVSQEGVVAWIDRPLVHLGVYEPRLGVW